MSDFDYIGMFIRNFRQANNESLQALADRSGVSRSMIAQIESSQKSPTLSVLAKLSQAMNINIEDLVKPPGSNQQSEVFFATKENLISKKASVFVCHLLSGKSASNPADMYQFYFTKHGRTAFSANPHQGAIKYLWVETGNLIVHLAGEAVQVSAGQGLKLNASTPHKFESRKGEFVKGNFFVAYQQ